jgi:hypothetical protein
VPALRHGDHDAQAGDGSTFDVLVPDVSAVGGCGWAECGGTCGEHDGGEQEEDWVLKDSG